jgi:hypothetical protein
MFFWLGPKETIPQYCGDKKKRCAPPFFRASAHEHPDNSKFHFDIDIKRRRAWCVFFEASAGAVFSLAFIIAARYLIQAKKRRWKIFYG